MKKRKTEHAQQQNMDLNTIISPELLQCPVCQDMLDLNFVQAACLHRTCATCWVKCKSQCPLCRRVDTNARSDPLTTSILRHYQRKTRCGTLVAGANLEEHQNQCTQCWTLKGAELEFEVEKLQAALKTSQNNVTRLENRVEVLESLNVRDSDTSDQEEEAGVGDRDGAEARVRARPRHRPRGTVLARANARARARANVNARARARARARAQSRSDQDDETTENDEAERQDQNEAEDENENENERNNFWSRIQRGTTLV